MELKQYWSVVWRRKWLVVVIVAAALGIAWTTDGMRPSLPRYKATATLLVTTLPGQLPAYPVEAIDSMSVARDVIRRTNVAEGPSALLGKTTVITTPGSSRVDIEVVDTDPERAARIGNAFAAVYLDRVETSGPVDPQVLGALRDAHERLRSRAIRTEESGADPTFKEWELNWLRSADEVVAHSYAEAWLGGLVGAGSTTQVRVIQSAVAPGAPLEDPKTRLAQMLAGIGGLALLGALALVFLLDYLDDRIRTEDDVERALGLAVLATLPPRRVMRRAIRQFVEVGRRHGALEGIPRPRPSVIPDARLAEAFQAARVQVDLARRAHPLRSILVASPLNGGDNSLVTACLGVAFAQTGRRTVLIAADLHRSALESLFGIENAAGIGEVAASELEPGSALRRTWVPDLFVVPSGTSRGHPADVLVSPGIARLLDLAQQVGDQVVIEAPPVLSGAEATILAPQCDGILLVLEAGETTRAQAIATKSALDKARNDAEFLGVLLTNVKDGREARRLNGRRTRRVGHRARS